MNKKSIFSSLMAVILTFSAVSASGCVYPETSSEFTNPVDIVMFMGQSNMAGRGYSTDFDPLYEEIVVGEEHGFDFRAVSDPTFLYPIITKEFGVNENANGITENKKTGSLVSAFVEAYYEATKVPVVAVSASEGGTNSVEWTPGEEGKGMAEEARRRLTECKDFLVNNSEYSIRNIFMLWLQGESDASNERPFDEYDRRLQSLVTYMGEAGVTHCYVIQIGNYSLQYDGTAWIDAGNMDKYRVFQAHQVDMCKEYDNMTLVSTKLAGMPRKETSGGQQGEGYMHLKNHYTQRAYDVVGWDAGKNTAYHVMNGKDPECKPFDLAADGR